MGGVMPDHPIRHRGRHAHEWLPARPVMRVAAMGRLGACSNVQGHCGDRRQGRPENTGQRAPDIADLFGEHTNGGIDASANVSPAA